MLLDDGGWYPNNRAVLCEHLKRWRERSRAGEPVVATFDFDNTSIFQDVGEAAMRYQLERMAFGMTTEELAILLPDEVSGVRSLSSGISLADVRADLLESHARLYDGAAPSLALASLEQPAPEPSSTELRNEQRDFGTRMAWLYAALEHEPSLGAGVAYPFLARWMGGFTKGEVRLLAKATVARSKGESPGRLTWRSDESKRSGPVRARFCSGLRALPEMKDLMRALSEAGVLVYIISASQQQLVEGAVLALGYPVPRERVFGMRLEQEGARLLPVSVDEGSYPLTWRGGKREIIERFLPAPPVLVGGDSDTDFEMLTSFAETELRLVINRDQRGDIRSLYDDERTLLQGRDDNAGRFVPARDSVPLTGESDS